MNLCLPVAALTVLLAAPPCASAQTSSPEELLDRWVALWSSYDLAPVYDLFLQDHRVSYFSSEYEGLRTGFETIVEHHRSLDFVEGGGVRDGVIWVDEVDIAEFGASALIGAVWYFGDPAAPDGAQRGPMSMLAVDTGDGWRIAHMHFANYPGG